MRTLLLIVLLSFTRTLVAPQLPIISPAEITVPAEINLDVLPPKQVDCLAEALYFESRGEPLIGQIAVGMVVLNRTEIPEFEGTICHVVYAKGQFEWTGYPHHICYPKLFERERALAVLLIRCRENDWCRNTIIPADFQDISFFSRDGFRSKNLQFVEKVGLHRFYRIREEYYELLGKRAGRSDKNLTAGRIESVRGVGDIL